MAWLLGVALVLRVGLPLWQNVAAEPAVEAATAAPELAAGSQAPDLAALQALDLFDSTPSTSISTTGAPAVLNTALNLRLEGVIIAGNASDSRAVIASGAERGSYRAGDALPAGAGIRVDSIARDHVVVDNRGQREVLWLYTGGTAATAGTGNIAAGNNPPLALPPGTDARVVRTAARLAEIIRVTPENVNGALVGYRLSPGAQLKEFVNLGLREGDIVVAADGIALNNVANMPKLLSLMDGATEVSFSLLRDGAPLTLNITLSPENN